MKERLKELKELLIAVDMVNVFVREGDSRFDCSSYNS